MKALLLHELRRSRLSFAAWGCAIGGLLAICIFIYPQMAGQMEQADALFASMGGFTQAFGMDKVGIGSLPGFYAVECGAVLALGGGLYAALCGANALAGEEKEGTAEFLLSHPLPRLRLALAKLAALAVQLTALQLVLYLLALGCIALTGEALPLRNISLLHAAGLCCWLQLAGLGFGVSAFLRRGGGGLGLGLALGLYFLNLFANLSDKATFLAYITPFACADGARVLADGALDLPRLLTNSGLAVVAAVVGCRYYCQKDIYA